RSENKSAIDPAGVLSGSLFMTATPPCPSDKLSEPVACQVTRRCPTYGAGEEQRMATRTVELRVPEPRPVVLDPRHTAVVVVDVEHEFLRPDGRRYMGERAERTLAPLAELLGRARDAGVPVVYVHSVRDADNAEFTVFGLDEHLIRGTWGAEYCAEIAPRPDEPVVDKECHDCFNHTQLEAVLKQLGITPCDHTVIVTGVALDVCVSHAAL